MRCETEYGSPQNVYKYPGEKPTFQNRKGENEKQQKVKINKKTSGILLPAMGQNNGEHFCYVVPLNKKSKTIILYFSQTIICSVEYECFLTD